MKLKRFIILLGVLSLLLGGALLPALAQVDSDIVGDVLTNQPQGWGFISASDVAIELLENPPFLLDVREPAEVAELGVIEGAVHIPLRTLAQNLALLPADLDAPIIVYCKSGHRGTIAMIALQVLGYTNVRNMSSGITGWIDGGNPVVAEPFVPEAGAGPAIDAELVAQVDDYLTNGLPQGWGVVQAADLATELLENPPFLLDVREQAEWDELGYIEGAVLAPVREVPANLSKLPTDMSTPIVVYCKGGARGAIVMTALQMMGYTDVRNLAGGITGWIGADFAVEGGEAPEVAAPAALDMVAHLDNYLNNVLPAGYGQVKPEDLSAELLENAPFLLDVREPAELEADGYIPGAVHIPLRDVAANLDLLPALDAPIVIYCKSGHRGTIGMVALQVLGYTNVRNLAGGINGWINGQFEVTTDPLPAAERGAAPDIDPALVAAVDDYLKNGLPQGWGVVQPADVSAELLENPPFLLDVREQAEWDTDGYIEGAVLVPLRTIAASLDALPADKGAPIVIYCKAGTRGAIAMTVVQMLGYTNVRNMAGGIMGWINAGFPVVGGAAAVEAPAAPVEVALPSGTPLPVEALQPVIADALAALPQGFASIPADTLKQQLGSVFVLDVRELDEYEAGHIAGAVNIPLRTLAQNLHLLPAKDAPIVIYCAIGHRGGIGTLALNLLGYSSAVSLRSGINGWLAAGGETVLESTPAVVGGAFPEVDADLWATVDAYLTSLPDGFSLISAEDLNIALAEAAPPFIVDVREASEFAQGHIAGAVNIPLRELGASLDQLPALDAAIVVYDHIGHRGVLAMAALQMLGYENVRSLKNGSNAWVAAGLPFVTE